MHKIFAYLKCIQVLFGLSLILCCPVTGWSQETSQRLSAKNIAYQDFHNGQARKAAEAIRNLATQTANIPERLFLLRDLVEICATAIEWGCAVQAEIEAYNIANADEKLRPLIPELYSYLVKAFVWEGNNSAIEDFLKRGGIGSIFYSHPAVASELNLALHSYYIRKNNQKAAENAYSAAVLGLLLVDPANKYEISKILVGLLEALFSSRDIVGSVSLADRINPFLTANLNHQGVHWAEYRSLTAQILASISAHAAAIPALDDAAKLNSRLDINDGIKAYRLAVANSLASLAAILDYRPNEAKSIHSRHPVQIHRQAIIAQPEFRTVPSRGW